MNDRFPQCPAYILHGPGHQRKTYCTILGRHLIHEAIYGIYEWQARWRGEEASTNFFDEPPPEPEPEPEPKPEPRKKGGMGLAKPNKAKFVLVPLEERIALGLTDPSSDMLTKAQQEEQRQRVFKYLDDLPPRYQEALWKFYWEQKSARVIALEMGYSRTWIFRLLKKACETLHQRLRQDLYKGESS